MFVSLRSAAGRQPPKERLGGRTTGRARRPGLYEREASVPARGAAVAPGALAILCLIHLECATAELGAVDRLHGSGRIRIRHLDEPEAAWLPCVPIADERDFLDGAVRGEQRPNGFLRHRER